MYTLEHNNLTLYFSGTYNSTENSYTVDVRTSTNHTATLLLTPAMEGIVTFLTYMGERVVSVCYLPDTSKEEIDTLGATTTLFATKTGLFIPSDSKLIPEFVDTEALQFMNPRDMVYYVIPKAKLSKGVNVMLSENWSRILTAVPLTSFTVAIYAPVPNLAELYRTVSEGNDCLEYTDMEPGYVVKVTYNKGNENIIEYIEVS